jgi:hypothetical protein
MLGEGFFMGPEIACPLDRRPRGHRIMLTSVGIRGPRRGTAVVAGLWAPSTNLPEM